MTNKADKTPTAYLPLPGGLACGAARARPSGALARAEPLIPVSMLPSAPLARRQPFNFRTAGEPNTHSSSFYIWTMQFCTISMKFPITTSINQPKRFALLRAGVLTLNSPAAVSLRRPPSEAVPVESKQNLTDGDARWKIPECWRDESHESHRKKCQLNSTACPTRSNASVSEGWEQPGSKCPIRLPHAQVDSAD